MQGRGAHLPQYSSWDHMKHFKIVVGHGCYPELLGQAGPLPLPKLWQPGEFILRQTAGTAPRGPTLRDLAQTEMSAVLYARGRLWCVLQALVPPAVAVKQSAQPLSSSASVIEGVKFLVYLFYVHSCTSRWRFHFIGRKLRQKSWCKALKRHKKKTL